MTKTRKVIKYLDKPLFFATMLLFLFGLIMVFSSSNVTAYMSGKSAYGYFIKQAIFLGVSAIVSFIIVKFNTKVYGIASTPLLIFIIAALVALLFYGKVTNQAQSWFAIGPITIQPSEFAKVAIIPFMARFYEVNEKRLSSVLVSMIPLIIGGVIAFLIILQPDLGTAIIFSLLVIFLFFLVPMPKGVKTKIVLFGLIAVIIAAFGLTLMGKTLIHDRQKERLTFTNPCSRLLDEGNQVCNGYIAINNGGLTGVGLGNSTQKYLYLPEPYTDFIFAIIVEELGVVTGVLLILVYAFILYRIYQIGKKSYTNRGALICYGVFFYIFLHICVNLMGILGLMPMTGVTLPFISYGGSFTLCLMVAVTFAQRVGIETKIRETEKIKKKWNLWKKSEILQIQVYFRGENGKFSAENAKFRVVIGGKMTFCLFAF